MKIVIGGAMFKNEIEALIHQYIPNATVQIKGDLDAAMAVKTGQADIYLGACDTGAGGSLGMAIALLGADKCKTLAMPGHTLSDEDIEKSIKNGVIAFGFTHQTSEHIVKILSKYLKS
ncbi:MAG: DUF2620 domain-containing protein [Brevinema sp.]